MNNFFAIAIGASLGATLRWLIGLAFASSGAALSLGTLCANWFGAYLIGLAFAILESHISLPSHWKLLLITGFLGSLTTFSSFSLEVVQMLQAQRWAAAIGTASLHLFGSLTLTALGIFTISALRG